MAIHPFDQITDDELRIIVKLVKDSYPNDKPLFAQVDRLDPPKKAMIQYLDAENKVLLLQLFQEEVMLISILVKLSIKF